MNIQSNISRKGFTLIEVVLVVVITLIILGIALPYYAHTYKGIKLRTAARTVSRVTRYARNMAILRGTTHTVGINHETMEIFLIAASEAPTDTADGELDQTVLRNLGYIEEAETPTHDKEFHQFFPEGLEITDFEMESEEESDDLDVYYINFHPNGTSEAFQMVFEDRQGMGIELIADPISSKVSSEFVQ